MNTTITAEATSSGDPTKVSATVVSTKRGLDVSLISGGGLLTNVVWDYVVATYPVATTEVYTFKNGGSGGTTTATVTVVYTDSTKATLSTVTKA